MTAHINAEIGDFAETVLMPGDPLRAKFIADTYLQDVREVTNVRNMLGFTGTYKGMPLSVMGHGMGMPSISIYAHELIHEYGVKKLMRIGSCGAVCEELKLLDLVVATGASCSSSINRERFSGYDFAAVPDFALLKACADTAEKLKLSPAFGNILSDDLFYGSSPALLPAMQKMNILAVEMEAAALFAIAAEARVQALCVLTVSDHLITSEQATSEQRQTSFNQMMELALETAFEVSK
ncbi:purine-nucleoside phosphorylase [Pseudovibrio exalbescens]|uniref:purine-nucleoside phosphorylase n=1 Tax=Pseudovibrio exalbescens TaxID=197461 RepID=UPI002365DE7E|nr:purine-nucleoside phosphorylase [Pseudovibrio exalbescens]MDD7911005.1 purine-nucleoside phosphorylase [Pseudovibrio exalbescens]